MRKPQPEQLDEICVLCGCSDDRPCLGGTVFSSVLEAEHVHRLVADVEVLPRGETCGWIGASKTVCSAHSELELEALEHNLLRDLADIGLHQVEDDRG